LLTAESVSWYCGVELRLIMCMTLKSQLVDLNNNNNEFCVIEGINNNNEENVEYIWKKNALTKDFYCILDYIYESI